MYEHLALCWFIYVEIQVLWGLCVCMCVRVRLCVCMCTCVWFSLLVYKCLHVPGMFWNLICSPESANSHINAHTHCVCWLYGWLDQFIQSIPLPSKTEHNTEMSWRNVLSLYTHTYTLWHYCGAGCIRPEGQIMNQSLDKLTWPHIKQILQSTTWSRPPPTQHTHTRYTHTYVHREEWAKGEHGCSVWQLMKQASKTRWH